QRLKRVDVMAIDASARSGQRIDELRVAVVDDVKKIEAASLQRQLERVGHETGHRPVSIETRPCIPPKDGLEATEEPWPDSDGFEVLGMAVFQILDQHFGGVVHAWPPFLDRVADDGQPEPSFHARASAIASVRACSMVRWRFQPSCSIRFGVPTSQGI